MRLVVTGTGRCGTGYMASRLGIGHEQVFTPWGKRPGDADASWLAAPHLPVGGVVLHVYRNPVEVAASMFGRKFFTKPSDWRDYLYRHMPELRNLSRLEQFSRYYIDWNRLILPHADLVFPITNPPWERITELTGITPEPDRGVVNRGPRSLPTTVPSQVWDMFHELQAATPDQTKGY